MSAIAPLLPVSPGPTTAADRRWPIESLWEANVPPGAPRRGGALPAELRARFAAPLEIPLRHDRPALVANFVSTLDGVVALDRLGATGGREISGGFEPDRFLMGLLRATADAVLVGAGTVRASISKDWSPQRVHPASAGAFAAWRRELGIAAVPTTVILTGSGRLDLGSVGTRSEAPLVVVTTADGARRLRRGRAPQGLEIVTLTARGHVRIGALLTYLGERGFRLVLSEAGPTLFGELLAARAVDELFLTVAPQLAGRGPGQERLALVESAAFAPEFAPWARLRGVMRSADHLFLRYDLSAQVAEGVS